MARRSAAARDRHEKRRGELTAELDKYRKLVRELRESSESPLIKTKKQKAYHKKILELKSQLEILT